VKLECGGKSNPWPVIEISRYRILLEKLPNYLLTQAGVLNLIRSAHGQEHLAVGDCAADVQASIAAFTQFGIRRDRRCTSGCHAAGRA
jgi:hypothetical protein